MSASPQTLQNQILNGAAKLDIELNEAQLAALYAYLELLVKWNKAYNLTAIREPERMVNLHLLDSLAVHPHIQQAEHIIDVGTGPGLPGIVLAIMNPAKKFTLLDSNGKKTRFLFQAKTALQLTNVVIVNGRVEDFKPAQLFDVVVSRAFASLADMTQWCAHLLANKGVFLAMKGQYPSDEIAAIAEHYDLIKSVPLAIVGVEGERHLLTIQPKV
ncbi:MAG: 16S rRNA (guanine(527)-N(7))-methyltransferase RsmG [Venatoribacter sp.]